MNTLRHRLIPCLLLTALVLSATGSIAQEQPPVNENTKSGPTLEQRLNRLCEQLEEQRIHLHIPGFAMAIVKDDKVILSKGFGVRDVERSIPVAPETLFAIGSSSKAFTAALVAMMVDAGKMQWDDSVRIHLPSFEVKDPTAHEQMTIRDLLCHRSGLDRTDLVWASGLASREDVLAAVAKAEPKSKFREDFHYQNVMYLAAGMAAANAAGMNGDWDRMVAERLLQPLGMTSSNTRIEEAQTNPNVSRGYRWDEDEQEFTHLPMRNLRSIAPAGAINSNVVDMAKWLRLQLNRGEVDGRRLLTAERFDEMWAKEIQMMPGVDYGLGWMLREWKGRKIVEHGGNIDGFAAQVTLVPEEQLGYVLLTNVTATPLTSMSVGLVCDALLGEWIEGSDAAPDVASFDKYLGTYRFDVLKNNVTVLVKDGKLAVDVPGQTVFTLKQPDENGKRYFELTDTIAVSFVEDESGRVSVMNFHQAGLIMECVKEGVTLPLEIGLDAAQKYLGTYHDSRGKMDVVVLHRNGRLAVDVPRQMIYDLRLPDDEGKWVFRATDAIAVRFEEDESGAVTGMTFFQGGQEHLMPRLEAAAGEDAAVPTVEEVIALHRRGVGADALERLGAIRITGEMNMKHQGIDQIEYTVIAHGVDRFVQSLDMGRFGWIKSGMNGDHAWSDSVFAPGEEKSVEETAAEKVQNPVAILADLESVFDTIEIVRLDTLREQPVVVVELGIGDDVRCTAMLNRETGLPMRYVYEVPIPSVGLKVETTMDLSDWKDVGGMNFPMQWEIESDLYGTIIVDIANVEANVALPADAFEMPQRR